MKTHTAWSCKPCRLPMFPVGDIYICRVVPGPSDISFDWLPVGAAEYSIYFRVKDEGSFVLAGKTAAAVCTYVITGLEKHCDYEFYVEADDGRKSRVRFARCGECVGTVVNYLHPEDPAYSFSGKYLCSPSLLRHPDGYLLASMDLFAANYPQDLTLIFRSDDDGRSWHYVCELFPCFWCKLFLFKGDVYALGCSTEYGDLLIGKSTDGGETFSPPSVLLRGGNGKNGEPGCHKNPQPVVEFQGRIWNTMEWGSWRAGGDGHAAMVLSAPIDSDLLDPESWTFSEPVPYDPSWKGTGVGPSAGILEGCLVPIDGGLYCFMRYQMNQMVPNFGRALVLKVDTDHPEKPLEYLRSVDFPGNHAKFMIKYDPDTQKYYSIICRITDPKNCTARNLLSLMVSDDGWNWRLLRDIYDKRDCSAAKVGLQYVDFIIENGEILFLCRTAMNHADNMHNSNYSTFDRISIKDC